MFHKRECNGEEVSKNNKNLNKNSRYKTIPFNKNNNNSQLIC